MYAYCIMFQYNFIVIVINKLNGTLESAGESCCQYLNPGHRGLINHEATVWSNFEYIYCTRQLDTEQDTLPSTISIILARFHLCGCQNTCC